MNVNGVELPDPLELVIKGRDAPVGYACQKCGASFLVQKHSNEHLYESGRKHQQEEAAQHCVKSCPCGQPIEDSYRLRCRACMAQMEAAKEHARFETSEKLTIEQYDGPVFWEDRRGSMGDGYFAGIDEVLDYCENEGVDVPEYVWACSKEEMKLDAEGIIEHAVGSMFEDAYDTVPAKAIISLQAYLDVWCKEVNVVSWAEDRSRAVLLHEDAAALAG